ncbi:MAG: mandelate racemase/muconate lactonizing enzyme family protein [Alphaproteobacteria bacterium]|nr:mandelate racemase/muconate lactonizing enzyme family protein [Alphaproteobacteria bacterium]
MKIEKIEDLHCDAGWRTFSFLKISTADGVVGWSEYTEADGSRGLTAIIRGLAEGLIGEDPRRVQRITSLLQNKTIQAVGGINQRAIAAIENALLDIKAKALGVPVYDMLGGAVRERIPVYWSHCGTYRVRNHALLGVPELRTYDDLARVGEEVKRRGFKALKTNILPSDGERLVSFAPGFGRTPGHPGLNIDRGILDAVRSTLRAFRDGAGPEMGLHLDINYHFKTEGNLKVAKAVEPFDLDWLEIDTWDAESLAVIRRAATCSIASCESLTHRRDFRPFFDAYAMDVAIVDVIWNGFLESLKIAAMAEPYEVNVAPHNYYGHLCSMIGAHFCAAVPNFRVMEIDIDSVPWRDELVTHPPEFENGELILPTRPGWGTDINEAGVRAHPVKG